MKRKSDNMKMNLKTKKEIPSSGKFLAVLFPTHGKEYTWAILEWCCEDPLDDDTYGLHSFAALGYMSDIKYINPNLIYAWCELSVEF